MSEIETNGEGTSTYLICFSCGGMVICATECKSFGHKCDKYGKTGVRPQFWP